MRHPAVTKALIKLLLSVCVLAALVFSCFSDINGGLKGVLAVFTVVLAFPITLLIGLDASRAIKREAHAGTSVRVLGRLLAFPQAIMGVVLIGFSVTYPVFAIHELVGGSADKAPLFVPAAGLGIAALGFVVGMHYVREGLGIKERKGGRHR